MCPHKQVCPFGNTDESVSEITSEDPEQTLEDSINVSTEEDDIKAEESHQRLVFNWSDAQVMVGADFDSFRDSILDNLGATDILEITGLYYANEVNSTSFENLGLARADQVRDLFPDLADERIIIAGILADNPAVEPLEQPFVSSSFRRVVNNESVREIEGRMVIRFPHASDDMLENQALNAYLDELVAHLKSTDDRVRLVGHTDSSATAAHNLRLGQKRAEAIKNLLVIKGISANRIITESRGEEEPIATNETKEGRQENRRVELTIIS